MHILSYPSGIWYDNMLQPICRSHFRASFFWWRILMDLIDIRRYVMRSILTSSALISKGQSTLKQSINCGKLYRFSYWPSSHYTKEDYLVIWCQSPILRITKTKFTSKEKHSYKLFYKCILLISCTFSFKTELTQITFLFFSFFFFTSLTFKKDIGLKDANKNRNCLILQLLAKIFLQKGSKSTCLIISFPTKLKDIKSYIIMNVKN